ncbi:MAG: carboxyl transferase domain-containing protein [Alphaproteobacteria bacterium]|jgi:acetyl-CoA carboxylase carboxyltransferase component|nr:carboxyl transferase domain-containing protein [Alphaproteobacteria bacterium]MDP6567494.1 carboxyl transferase domain-containing protein [Alphaproteobacteria bacterium]MDP6813345.1 carboxyl transferase domain-containing protein [Alphaproteobacteria bacterium]
MTKGKDKGARADLARVRQARAARLDEARPKAVAQQQGRGLQTIRQSIAALIDDGSFVEYGGLAAPARDDMPGAADGLVMGTARIDGDPVVVVGYDYTVHAGTQSAINHRKANRMFALAERNQWPLVGWWDGGGARPHDMILPARGSNPTFVTFARLSGKVPTVALVTGRAFAGQANLAGLSDLVIATPGATMGMAGPPLVAAALGHWLSPEEIGPMEVHEAAGAIDVLCEDEVGALATARQYLGFFRGRRAPGAAPDQTKLRDLIPENPRRAYNVRRVVEGLADTGSVLELRPNFGKAAVTALMHLDGWPVGAIANQPMVLAGAIDSDASDKIARFIQLCDAYDIPILFLCDTPGLMVGPEVEGTALVRHSARILTALANATTPFMTVVLRKAYGLGYYVMGAAACDPDLLLAWPTAEFGGMGIEGAVNIIHRAELEAIEDEAERAERHRLRTEELKTYHTALATAERFHVDDVIDPAETRAILANTLAALPAPAPGRGRKRTVDPW